MKTEKAIICILKSSDKFIDISITAAVNINCD